MKNILIFLFATIIALTTQAQITEDIKNLQPAEEFENIHVQKIYSDSNSTGFVIWVKKSVKAHKHVTHTEHLYILEGEGQMEIGTKDYLIKPGDYLVIPENTAHSLKVTSSNLVKVLSIQTPEFLGNDRVFIE
ncbi:MAG: cupin domain-containing protein [Bacteroidia bacterium]|nr:cupin domain-containing protein [Bacteroidia bacterium]